jgi:polyhydroxyalkanoate synthesis regulator phasin
MIESLLELLGQVVKLGVLTVEERHRYEDDVLKLKKAWYEEYNKLESDDGSDNALDDIKLQLSLTIEALNQTLRAKNAQN